MNTTYKLAAKAIVLYFALSTCPLACPQHQELRSKDREEVVGQTVETNQGELKIVRNHRGKYKITLAGKDLFKSSRSEAFVDTFALTSPRPEVIKVIKRAYLSNTQVIVFQQFNDGNECEGNEVWFLELYQRKTYKILGPVGHCFGNHPKIWTSQGKLFLSIDGGYPGGYRNRMVGYKKGGLWVLSKGQIKKLK